MEKGRRTIHRICRCGCGREVPPHFDEHGRHKGYYKCCPGHKYKRTLAQDIAFERSRRLHVCPIGTKRLTKKSKGNIYCEIKTTKKGKWKLEHRWVMEQKIGRPLKTSEHVHHRNGNRLDNRIQNLLLMSAQDHGSMNGKKLVKRKKGIFGFPICPICGWRHPPHPVH